jgi:hypothetical protein
MIWQNGPDVYGAKGSGDNIREGGNEWGSGDLEKEKMKDHVDLAVEGGYLLGWTESNLDLNFA